MTTPKQESSTVKQMRERAEQNGGLIGDCFNRWADELEAAQQRIMELEAKELEWQAAQPSQPAEVDADLVAIAIYQATYSTRQWDLDHDLRNIYRRYAKAAIAAYQASRPRLEPNSTFRGVASYNVSRGDYAAQSGGTDGD